MVVKHNVSHGSLSTSLSFKSLSIIAIVFLAICLSPTGFAKSENPPEATSYGPIKSGQTLWEIAKSKLPDDSISVEQLAYAIYASNPDAFRSGNMNILKTGAFLTIPDTDFILNTSSSEAKKELNSHVHALDVLRVDAKQLKTAKANTRSHQQHIKKLQKQLGKYRHKSKNWNNTYLRLVSYKRKYNKSKKKVVKLRGLLLEKATLKYTSIPKKDPIKTGIKEVNNRLTEIQSSLENLNQSNSTLIGKVQELATLNQRVDVLEKELGKHDDLVIQLKNTLETAQEAITQQSLKSEELFQRFQKFETSSSSSIEPKATEKDQSDEETEIEFNVDSIPEKASSEPPSQPTQNTPPENNNSPINPPENEGAESDIESMNEIESTLSVSTEHNWSDSFDSFSDYDGEYKNIVILEEDSPQIPAPVILKTAMSQLEDGFFSTVTPTKLVDTNIPKTLISTREGRNFQRNSKQTSSDYTSAGYWGDLIKEKIIIIGSILNGIILIFFLIKFFFKKKAPVKTEEPDFPFITTNNYIPWQDRIKPKQSGF